MAYLAARSCNAELAQGQTDGSYKQVNRDRGGIVDPATLAARSSLDDVWYGIHEAPSKQLPDGTAVYTETYAPTSPPHLC